MVPAFVSVMGCLNKKIVDGYQVELPDNWLRDGYVWETRKADRAVTVKFGGNVRLEQQGGRLTAIHENYEPVLAVPYDVPIVGANCNTVNTLRYGVLKPINLIYPHLVKAIF